MADLLIDTIDRYELRGKVSVVFGAISLTLLTQLQVGWIICDGAAVNGTTLCEFEKKLNDEDVNWSAKGHVLAIFSDLIVSLY